MCTRQSHGKTYVRRINKLEVKMFDDVAFPKTSIMATIGPASFNPAKNKDLIEEMSGKGMNLIRINLAHVNNDDDRKNLRLLISRMEEVVHTTKRAVGISIDLGGPKFRIGNIESVEILKGAEFVLTLDKNYGVKEGTLGNAQRCSLDVEPDFLIENIHPQQSVLIDDGYFELEVTKVEKKDIHCVTKNDWKLTAHKGVNFPNCKLTKSALTEKDSEDLYWLFDKKEGIAKDGQIDFVSLSFVKSPDDIQNLKAILRNYKQQHIKVLAKIETVEAVDRKNGFRNFDQILEKADGIMVARGDLGAELGITEVPEIQKELIRRANKARKSCIVATQMLESMKANRVPTRAEVTDVSNAIVEGADIVMLSAETSTGIDPPRAVEMMAKIARRTEDWIEPRPGDPPEIIEDDFTQAIGRPIVEWAADIKADLIVVYTTSGHTAEVISHYRPQQPIIAITHSYDTIMGLNLYWGVYSALINYIPKSAVEAKQIASTIIKQLRLAPPGAIIIMTMSMEKIGIPESRDTNTIHVFKL